MPPTIPAHYHHVSLIWVLFLAGGALHAALNINDLAVKNKLQRRAVFKVVFIPVLFRAFASAMVFLLIWQSPDVIDKIAGLLGHAPGPDEAAVFSLPMNNALAGLYGLFLDSILGYIPVLKSQLPVVGLPVQGALTNAAKANEKVADAIADAQIAASQKGDSE